MPNLFPLLFLFSAQDYGQCFKRRYSCRKKTYGVSKQITKARKFTQYLSQNITLKYKCDRKCLLCGTIQSGWKVICTPLPLTFLFLLLKIFRFGLRQWILLTGVTFVQLWNFQNLTHEGRGGGQLPKQF